MMGLHEVTRNETDGILHHGTMHYGGGRHLSGVVREGQCFVVVFRVRESPSSLVEVGTWASIMVVTVPRHFLHGRDQMELNKLFFGTARLDLDVQIRVLVRTRFSLNNRFFLGSFGQDEMKDPQSTQPCD